MKTILNAIEKNEDYICFSTKHDAWYIKREGINKWIFSETKEGIYKKYEEIKFMDDAEFWRYKNDESILTLDKFNEKYRKKVGNFEGQNGWSYAYSPFLNKFVPVPITTSPIEGGWDQQILDKLNKMMEKK